MNGFYYVNILVSETNEKVHYSGITRELNARLYEHNRGRCPHTAKHRPWKIETQSRSDRKRKLAVLSAI
jgi:putative endonuclease